MTTSLAPFAGLSQDDFLAAAQGNLPKGLAWPRYQEAVQSAFWRAAGGTFKRLNDAISTFFGSELDPSQTVTYLPAWYARFGLPTIDWATTAQLQALLVWRLRDRGGFADSRYIAMMATLGVGITCAHPGGAAAYALTIHAPAALTADQRGTLVTLVTPRVRASVVLAFVYDL